jgi:hypothetical protein
VPPRPGLGAHRLDRLDPVQHLEQQGVLLGRFQHRPARGGAQGKVNHHADDQRERHRAGGGQRHGRPADEVECEQEQRDERHVAEHRDGGRAQEFADRVEVLQRDRKAAGRARAHLALDRQHLLEHPVAEHHVEPLAGRIDHVAAQRAQQEVEQRHDHDAGGQHPQRVGGGVRHHAVVDRQGEHRADQRQHVDHDRRQDGIGKDPAILADAAPEPGFRRRQVEDVRAHVELEARPDVEHAAGIERRQLGHRPGHRAVAGVGLEILDLAALQHPHQDDGAAVLQGHDRRQGQGRDTVEADRVAHRHQPDAARRFRQARHAEPPLLQGHPGAQLLRRVGAAVVAGQESQALGQGVGSDAIGAHGILVQQQRVTRPRIRQGIGQVRVLVDDRLCRPVAGCGVVHAARRPFSVNGIRPDGGSRAYHCPPARPNWPLGPAGGSRQDPQG